MRNFDTIPRLVPTVDGEILSEIAIHNFEKNRKIESHIRPYGQKTNEFSLTLTLTSEPRYLL